MIKTAHLTLLLKNREKINDNIKDNKSGLEKVYDAEYDEFIETLKKHKVKE